MVIHCMFSSMCVSTYGFLLQDFWTMMAKDLMTLMTPTTRMVPIVQQGTLVCLTPTVVPYVLSSGPKTESEIDKLPDDLDVQTLDVEL